MGFGLSMLEERQLSVVRCPLLKRHGAWSKNINSFTLCPMPFVLHDGRKPKRLTDGEAK